MDKKKRLEEGIKYAITKKLKELGSGFYADQLATGTGWIYICDKLQSIAPLSQTTVCHIRFLNTNEVVVHKGHNGTEILRLKLADPKATTNIMLTVQKEIAVYRSGLLTQ